MGPNETERRYCPSHERNEEAISELISSCATNGAQIRMLMWILGGSAVLMMSVITGVVGFTAYTYQHSDDIITMVDVKCSKTSAQIATSNSGISRNRREIKSVGETLEDHEARLRKGGL